MTNEAARGHLYNDNDEEIASGCVGALMPQSLMFCGGLCHYAAADVNASKFYIVCEMDEAVSPEQQRLLAEGAQANIIGNYSGHCSHCPFITPEGAEELVGIVGYFLA
ncbi:hypothetical protein BX600DRAFT_443764 [Xylariales sp. PMI_506]|nr:hypothetical protein BX600DRAFT_443764 [Xylariales sp. PMI_506]